MTSETLTSLLTANDLESWQRSSSSFYPDTQSLELVEAYVLQPDGRWLAARGIESNPVLVDWGYEFELLPLPEAAQFNHAMIYLPESLLV